MKNGALQCDFLYKNDLIPDKFAEKYVSISLPLLTHVNTKQRSFDAFVLTSSLV